MTSTTALIDPLAEQLPREIQIQAARHAQDGFALAFRLSIESPEKARRRAMQEAAERLTAWAQQAGEPAMQPLRGALILNGLDQWGLAYSQIFGAAAMNGLSELISLLRAAPDASATLQALENIGNTESSALSFKAELRKAIHLALWHAMIAASEREEALDILKQLGGMMLRLPESMPTLGWIIVANTLADIQIRCLEHSLASTGLAQEMTQSLFGALNQQLPAEQRQKIMPAATQTVMAWQQSNRDATRH